MIASPIKKRSAHASYTVCMVSGAYEPVKAFAFTRISCGSAVVIAIRNAHTQDDATDSLSLRSFYGKNYVLL